MNTVDELRDCLTMASNHVEDDPAQAQVEEAIALVNKLSGAKLLECPVCGRWVFQSGSSTTTAALGQLSRRHNIQTAGCMRCKLRRV